MTSKPYDGKLLCPHHRRWCHTAKQTEEYPWSELKHIIFVKYPTVAYLREPYWKVGEIDFLNHQRVLNGSLMYLIKSGKFDNLFSCPMLQRPSFFARWSQQQTLQQSYVLPQRGAPPPSWWTWGCTWKNEAVLENRRHPEELYRV